MLTPICRSAASRPFSRSRFNAYWNSNISGSELAAGEDIGRRPAPGGSLSPRVGVNHDGVNWVSRETVSGAWPKAGAGRWMGLARN